MKFLLLLILPLPLISQTNYAYEEAIARGTLFHLQKKHKEAILQYEKAFQNQRPDALNAYKAAGVYSLDSNIKQAFFYLQLALQSGWAEADVLATDPYFDYVLKTAPRKWKNLVKIAHTVEKQYEKSLKLPALRQKINQMTLNDQRLRYARIQANSKEERRRIAREIHFADSVNRAEAKAILKQYGWPKLSDIGKDGQNNFWLLVQHADDDVLFQKNALDSMEKLRDTKEINLENYAFLYDRVLCNLNYRQVYGTQVNWSEHGEATGFRRIFIEDEVDARRKDLGLLPLSIYALTYGFVYSNTSAAKAKENDKLLTATIQRLIDSARYFYNRNEFQKVYDNYNSASMILGGMGFVENFEAALLFTMIAAKDSNPQYRSIALDFLNLLYLQGNIKKYQLQPHTEFRILYSEPRWLEIWNNIK